jgi:hypothetical protein
MLDCVEDVPKVHSALLALDDPAAELPRRLWEAQVGVLFAVVEQGRRAVLERIGPTIDLPVQTPFGEIHDPRDLEIGQLDWQITWGCIATDAATRLQVRWLKTIRDALAHLEPVKPDVLLRAASGWAA